MFVVIACIMSLIISGCRKKEEGIVAKVNGEVITKEEFEEEFEVIKKVRQKQFGEDILSQEIGHNQTYEDVLKEDMLWSLILEKLIAEELDKMDIKVTDEEINQAIKNYYTNELELTDEKQYKEYLEKNGFTEETVKRGLKRQLVYVKHKEDFLNKTDLSEDEMKKYFEANKDSLIKVRISHILVQTKEEGKKILEKLKKGGEFHSLAATKSMDSKSAIQGGDLGYYTRGKMVKEFKELENVAFTLGVGEISELVQTELGYHIVLVEDRKDSYEDLREDIIEILKNEKYIKKISELRDKADIKLYMKEDIIEEKNNH
jgi:foldase protein PrsA